MDPLWNSFSFICKWALGRVKRSCQNELLFLRSDFIKGKSLFSSEKYFLLCARQWNDDFSCKAIMLISLNSDPLLVLYQRDENIFIRRNKFSANPFEKLFSPLPKLWSVLHDKREILKNEFFNALILSALADFAAAFFFIENIFIVSNFINERFMHCLCICCEEINGRSCRLIASKLSLWNSIRTIAVQQS